MAISSDYAALCQSQIGVLTQTLGAVSVVVYMAKHWTGTQNPELVPIMVYPDQDWQPAVGQLSADLQSTDARESDRAGDQDSRAPIEAAEVSGPVAGSELPQPPSPSSSSQSDRRLERSQSAPDSALVRWQDDAATAGDGSKLVIPLIHNGALLGFLATTRLDRPWSDVEQTQVQNIAQTLAIACFMDQQNRWLQRNLHQKQLVYNQQSQGFHDLLHQFRNPLTALRTFGKLLLKRSQTETDAAKAQDNQKVVTSIVRESDRLQSLLTQFDQTLAAGDSYWQTHPTGLPAARSSEPQTASADRDADGRAPQRKWAAGSGIKVLPAAQEDYDVFEPAAVGDDSGDGPNSTATPPSPPIDARALSPTDNFGRSDLLKICSWADILLPLLDSTQAIAQAKPIEVKIDLPQSGPSVMAIPRALEEALSNLLDNAVKYAPAGSWLYVRSGFSRSLEAPHSSETPNSELSRSSQLSGVLIANGGPGIPPQDLNRIFERHYRGVQAKGNIPGTGLGLAIAQDLVNQMAGKLEAYSPADTCPYIPLHRLHTLNAYSSLKTTGTAFVL
ncbi:MAG: ATP-binding protein, partial [Cyanobacteria bacterium P01_C01_bin.73]